MTIRTKICNKRRQIGMMQCSSNDSKRTPQIQRILWEDMEQRYSLPHGVLSQGQITHFPSDANMALWTDAGGVVACSDENLAASLAAIISEHEGEDYMALLSKLQETLNKNLSAVSCRFDLFFYCCSSPISRNNDLRKSVEILPPDEPGLDYIPPNAEHVFVIRDGSVIVAQASNVPKGKIGNIPRHTVGVRTHPDYRRQGLGKTVVSALVEHIISESGIALWSANAKNIASRRLAHSVGFVEDIRQFEWKFK